MFKLLKPEDADVLINSNFVKNAVFIKDLYSFYDAYLSIMDNKNANDLPNFCYLHDGSFCLEGICLFMKMYATEFGFETLKLSLSYLKILYYTLASYTKDSELTIEEKLFNEYTEYRTATEQAIKANSGNLKEREDKYNEKKKIFDKETNKYAKYFIGSKVLNIATIFMFIFSFFLLIVPSMFYAYKKITLSQTWIFVGVTLAVGFAITLILKGFCNYCLKKSNNQAYVVQTAKKSKDEAFGEYKEIKDKVNRILCEKYEYCSHFTGDMWDHNRRLEFYEILNKAKEYKLLSYNIANDVKKLFATQQDSINEIKSRIEAPQHIDNPAKFFEELYVDISNQDWLYYNGEVRYTFIKKFIDIANKTHDWKVKFGDEKIMPFGVDVWEIAREEIAYLVSKDNLFVASSIDKFMGTKYIKNLNELEIGSNSNPDALKNVKVNYINHFYNYKKLGPFKQYFADKKKNLKGTVGEENLINNEKIPAYVYIKLKLIENKIGIGNSDAGVIKQMALSLFGEEEKVSDNKQVVVSARDIIYPSFECSELVDEGDVIKYKIGNNIIIGHKLADIK